MKSWENSANPGLFWDLAGETKSSDIPRFNFYYFDGSFGRDRLTITGQGCVGINQTNPQANLQVNGDVRITDLSGASVRPVYADAHGPLTTGASQYLSLSGDSFHPEVNNSSISHLSAVEGAYFLATPTGYNGLTAPVNLPHGSVLKKITVYYEDSNTTYDAAFIFSYYQTPSNTFSSLATCF